MKHGVTLVTPKQQRRNKMDNEKKQDTEKNFEKDFKEAVKNKLKKEGISDEWMNDHLIIEVI